MRLTEEERIEAEEKGLQEGLKKTAANMLKDNISIDAIIKYTGLSKKEIENLSLKQ